MHPARGCRRGLSERKAPSTAGLRLPSRAAMSPPCRHGAFPPARTPLRRDGASVPRADAISVCWRMRRGAAEFAGAQH